MARCIPQRAIYVKTYSTKWLNLLAMGWLALETVN
jgi:hypothetical protein